jgi:hypothetical protein
MLDYSNFDILTEEVGKMVQMLIPNLNVFGWKEFGGSGNDCWNPHVFANEQEKKEDALMLAAVKYVIPYNSHEHILLSAGISTEIGCEYCTYPWLIQAIAYALKDLDCDKLNDIITVSKTLQLKMKQ